MGTCSLGYHISILSLPRRQIDINLYHSIMVSVEAEKYKDFQDWQEWKFAWEKVLLCLLGPLSMCYIFMRV